MAAKVEQVLLIVNVIDIDFVVLSPFKVILDIEALDPGGVQVVHDDLCHTEALPLSALLAVKD